MQTDSFDYLSDDQGGIGVTGIGLRLQPAAISSENATRPLTPQALSLLRDNAWRRAADAKRDEDGVPLPGGVQPRRRPRSRSISRHSSDDGTMGDERGDDAGPPIRGGDDKRRLPFGGCEIRVGAGGEQCASDGIVAA